MKKPIISLTSDFGEPFALAQVEAVIHTLNPHSKFIVASNNITSFSILEGAFVLQKFLPFTPKGSVHIGVVDPGVGSERRGIVIQTKNYWFVGPDNGLLYPAASTDGIVAAYQINEGKFKSCFSNTFHGRDIFAKVAAYLSLGKKVTSFAQEIEKETLKNYSFPADHIAHIDTYGNIKLTTPSTQLKYGQTIKLRTAKKSAKLFYAKTFADVRPGNFLLYKGSHDTLEIAINLGSAAKTLGVSVGDKVVLAT